LTPIKGFFARSCGGYATRAPRAGLFSANRAGMFLAKSGTREALIVIRNIVVIGGVAAGMSAASQARRRAPQATVVVLEKGPFVSYAACGMPYNIEAPARSMQDLVVIDAERFRRERRIDVRTRHQVVGMDVVNRKLNALDLSSGRQYEVPFDSLVIATGASAVRPDLRGMDLPGVFVLRTLDDGIALKRYMEEAAPRRAVILGAGYVGMEMAEVLRRRGLKVVMLEKLPSVLPGFDPAISEIAQQKLESEGVEVHAGVEISSVERAGKGLVVVTDGGRHEADLVLVSVGVRPNVELARSAGIKLGSSGAIAIDNRMRTNVSGIYAAGDCAEVHHLVSGETTFMPLGTTANKQGKAAGANAAGGDMAFAGIVGTAGFKLFDLEVARTGLAPAELLRFEPNAARGVSVHASRGHGYPGGGRITTVLYAHRSTHRLLGAQMIGPAPVATRIDVFATALHARLTLERIETLDLAYAPPFAPCTTRSWSRPASRVRSSRRRRSEPSGRTKNHAPLGCGSRRGRRQTPARTARRCRRRRAKILPL
jgi:NADPH-dependent 2,4-dienoyl-CoA reductase/sulfur reductase-like enzyme